MRKKLIKKLRNDELRSKIIEEAESDKIKALLFVLLGALVAYVFYNF
jgi:hypothetical protein